MSFWIALLNDITVSYFGSILSASFCEALNTRKNRIIFWGGTALMLVPVGIIFSLRGVLFLRNIYPLVMHLPLLVLLCIMTGKLLWTLISILTAYLCCEVRRWIILLMIGVFNGGELMQDVGELIVTLPLLLLMLKYFSPVIRRLSKEPMKKQCMFGMVPAVYYIFDYGTRVYTDLLYRGGAAAVEFMPFVCCIFYMVFLLYYTDKERKEIRFQEIQNSLNLQLTQSVREISALRESQTMAAHYRHDLRHHLQYLSACIENGQVEQAMSYINGICKEVETYKVKQYCENEAANLILSSFAGRAEKLGIAMRVRGELPRFILVSDSDLCVLLSNALENALRACRALVSDGREDCSIDVSIYEKNKKLFLQIINPFKGVIHFEDGIPVSDRSGHGIGIQSICAIVERYGGVYSFSEKDGQFIMRLSV